MVPWIAQDNHNDCYNHIRNSSCRVLCGHFEIVGFQVMSGIKHTHGLSSSDLNKFEMVLSGHFHLKQSEKNIHYLGSQYQMNFGDVNYKKGFHILDTSTMEMKFIENENSIFHIFNYDDSTEDGVKNIAKFVSKTDLKGAFVRIFIREKNRSVIFDKMIDALWSAGIQDLSVVDDASIVNPNNNVEFDEAEDTISIINREIDSIQRDFDKNKLKGIVKDLYMESLKI